MDKRLAMLEAEPIADKLPYQGSGDSPAWRRKRVRKLGIKVISVDEEKSNDDTKSSDGDNDLLGEGRRGGTDAQEKNKRNQEKL